MSVNDLTSALQKALSIASNISTAWENVKYSPKKGIEYQQVNILLAEPDNSSMGRCFKEQGFMQVTLRYPSGKGTKEINDQAQLIRDYFFRGQSFTKNSTKVIVQRTPEISGGHNEDDRYVINVKIRFFAYE